MLGFRLFGVPVVIQPGFWLMACALGIDYLMDPRLPKTAFVIWLGVVLVSIIVHELGHALAIMRHRISPSITLHALGGLTSWHGGGALGRADRIVVSAAGPAAGFLLAALVYAVAALAPRELPQLVQFALHELVWVNVVWGIFNLIPVLPFDGGHILEHALGPARARTAALVSLVSGAAIALFFLLALRSLWGTIIVGLGALQSYQRLQTAGGLRPPGPLRRFFSPSTRGGGAMSPELRAQLDAARALIDAAQYDRARAAAQSIVDSGPPPAARNEAWHIAGWASLLAGQVEQAFQAVAAIKPDNERDAALVGAVLLADGRLDLARALLEQARARGDNRKEVVGPLIQILIRQHEPARAAAIAFDIVDSLSAADARQIAGIAREASAHEWAWRLSEAAFERSGEPDDAFDAARSRAMEGDRAGALALLRRAVAAGFADAARLYSDAALAPLDTDGELETLLPRPAPGSG
ncbi:MAG: site-2 protease family protein [Deltaproteobacteria bacterium]|nr:site-2 protease family protein [Deltaproteobacteria bacterium]